jgi:superfamily II DNA helicase RecQ
LPTGFGKTLISQACSLALREKGPTLVISPLISLIDDQEESYLKLNNRIRSKSGTELKIEFLRSTEPYDLDDINYKLLSGSIDVLCCSPETLVMKQGTGLMETIRRLGLTELGRCSPFLSLMKLIL